MVKSMEKEINDDECAVCPSCGIEIDETKLRIDEYFELIERGAL